MFYFEHDLALTIVSTPEPVPSGSLSLLAKSDGVYMGEYNGGTNRYSRLLTSLDQEVGTVQGQVLYWDTTAVKWKHSTNMIWNESSLIITGNQTTKSNSVAYNTVYVANGDSSVNAPQFNLVRSRGNLAVPAAISTGDWLGTVIYYGVDNAVTQYPAAQIMAMAEDTPTPSVRGTSIRFDTIIVGSTTLSERLKIQGDGSIKFNAAYSFPTTLTGSSGYVLGWAGSGTALSWIAMASSSQMVYPGAGIALSTGSAWGTSITNNSANWNTAYGWGNHAGLYLLVGGTAVDSDKVDGIHAAAIVYGGASYRKGTNLITDWNQTTFPDVVFLSSEGNTTNAPTTGYIYGMQTSFHRSGDSYRGQLVADLYGDEWYIRTKGDTAWTAWKKIIHSGNIGSQSVGNADTVDSIHASGFVQTTYNSSLNSDSRNSRGVTRLYRSNNDSDYSVQTTWDGTYWLLQGYGSGDAYHSGCRVAYADTAGSVSGMATASGTSGYLAKFTGSSALGNSVISETSGNVTIGTGSACRFLVSSYIGGASPTLGALTNISSIIAYDNTWGMVFGMNPSTGHGWIQQQRVDGTAAAYNLALQPSGGNVGIGTTSPQSLLHLFKTGTVGDLVNLTVEANDNTNNTSANINFVAWDRTAYIRLNASSGLQSVGSTGDFILSNTAIGSGNILLLTNGKVGIGTTSPSYKLDVQTASGAVRVNVLSGDGSEAQVAIGAGEYWNLVSKPYFGTNAHGFEIQKNGATKFSIDTNGNVGIGTTDAYGLVSMMSTENTTISSTEWGSAVNHGTVATIYNLSQTTNSFSGIRLATRNSGAAIWGIYNISTGSASGRLGIGFGAGGSGSELYSFSQDGTFQLKLNSATSYIYKMTDNAQPMLRFTRSDGSWGSYLYANGLNAYYFAGGLGVAGADPGQVFGLFVGTSGIVQSMSVDVAYFSNNIMYSAGWALRGTNSYPSSMLEIAEGTLNYYTAPAGSAGSTVSVTNRFSIGVTGNVNITGTCTVASDLFLTGNILMLNKAQNGWLTTVTRNTGAAEAVWDLSNIGTISCKGDITDVALRSIGNHAVYATADGVLTNSSSDYRLKENILALTHSVDAMGLLKNDSIYPIFFDWKDRRSRRDIGFTAQMFEGIPGLTGVNNDGMLSLNYDKLTTLLWQQNKELLKRIEELEKQLS